MIFLEPASLPSKCANDTFDYQVFWSVDPHAWVVPKEAGTETILQARREITDKINRQSFYSLLLIHKSQMFPPSVENFLKWIKGGMVDKT